MTYSSIIGIHPNVLDNISCSDNGIGFPNELIIHNIRSISLDGLITSYLIRDSFGFRIEKRYTQTTAGARVSNAPFQQMRKVYNFIGHVDVNSESVSFIGTNMDVLMNSWWMQKIRETKVTTDGEGIQEKETNEITAPTRLIGYQTGSGETNEYYNEWDIQAVDIRDNGNGISTVTINLTAATDWADIREAYYNGKDRKLNSEATVTPRDIDIYYVVN